MPRPLGISRLGRLGTPIIETRDLTRRFGAVEAVSNLTLTVNEGEYFGLLGPNGAGKSTAIRILTTLLRPTSGEARVAGLDVATQADLVRREIALVSDKVALYPHLTTRENLQFFGHLYNVPSEKLEPRIDEILRVVLMEKWADAPVEKFSTGMKQRVNIARALITGPRVLFLDEPTLGLDPASTREIREFTRALNKDHGTTIVLTTHQMSEADLLCDRIAVVDHGKLVACDTSRALKAAAMSSDTRVVEVEIASGAGEVARVAKERGLVTSVELSEPHLRMIAAPGDLDALLDVVREHGKGIRNVKTNEPSLEDVFLALTGRALRDEPAKKRGRAPAWAKALVKYKVWQAKRKAARAEPHQTTGGGAK